MILLYKACQIALQLAHLMLSNNLNFETFFIPQKNTFTKIPLQLHSNINVVPLKDNNSI